MRAIVFLAAAAAVCASSSAAQTLSAPPGWKSEARAGGVAVFTPPDLQAGEVYTISVYDLVPLNDTPLENWLRAFAGPTGTGPGKLAAPLNIEVRAGTVVGRGTYQGPAGTLLDVLFVGVAPDNGQSILVVRTLSSHPNLYARYKAQVGSISRAAGERARTGERLAAKAEAVKREAALAEARRYKHVLAPGKGVKPDQIAGIVHSPRTDDVYLLLRDGTIYHGLPVVPDQMDVALSRRREPRKWGRWRKQQGQYLASWSGAPFKPLLGQLALASPPGLRLQGRWGTGSASGDFISGSSYRLWGVTFTKGGRLKKTSAVATATARSRKGWVVSPP